MSVPRMKAVRQVGVAALLSVSLALAVAGCGSNDEVKSGGDNGKPPSAPVKNPDVSSSGEGSSSGSSEALVTLKGDKGVEMVIQEAKRDSGGFLTLSGKFNNSSSRAFVTPVQWSGEENSVASAGPSLAAMTLVDSKEKKRYYVLRDTDNRPLTTTQYAASIKAGESLPFFAQFPAPPSSTSTVSLQFPGFPSTPIEISG